MTVPYIFATFPASNGIPLAYLDADFAYATANPNIQMEQLTVSATNTLSALSLAPNNNLMVLIVNGAVFLPVGSPQAFSVSGTTITWLSSIFSLNVGDSVFAIYTYG
jgi:hypothetical protein